MGTVSGGRQILGVWMSASLGIASGVILLSVWWVLYSIGAIPYPPFDLGDYLIIQSPGSLATWAIETLGSFAQRAALGGGLLAWIAVWGALGVLIGRVPNSPLAGFVPFVLAPIAVGLGVWSEDTTSPGRMLWLSIAFASTLAGVGVLLAFWIRRLVEYQQENIPISDSWIDHPGNYQRRELLRQVGVIAFVFGGGGPLAGQVIRSVTSVGASTSAGIPLDEARATVAASVQIPTPQPEEGSHNDFAAPVGVRSRMTSNSEFYVVDISTRDPNLHEDGWVLRVHGLVDRELLITWQDLLSFPSTELDGTLMCISYEHDNGLISSTRWTGVRLRDVLERSGIVEGTVDLICRGSNGYSDSIPLAKALEPTTLLAYGMNGTTLPRSHGFPCRLYVPGLYGEKNVKWLQEIELSAENYLGFWQERGWTDTAVVNTVAIIDTPRGTVSRDGAIVQIGGIAFAGDRGISGVQVKVDDGDWREAVVEKNDPPLMWQRWRYDWSAEVGRHDISVRAIDGNGDSQIEAERSPHPDGMTGLHSVSVDVV